MTAADNKYWDLQRVHFSVGEVTMLEQDTIYRIEQANDAADVYEAIEDYLERTGEMREDEDWDDMMARLNDPVVNRADARINELGE